MEINRVKDLVDLAKEYVSKGYNPLQAIVLAEKILEFKGENNENIG